MTSRKLSSLESWTGISFSWIDPAFSLWARTWVTRDHLEVFEDQLREVEDEAHAELFVLGVEDGEDAVPLVDQLFELLVLRVGHL